MGKLGDFMRHNHIAYDVASDGKHGMVDRKQLMKLLRQRLPNLTPDEARHLRHELKQLDIEQDGMVSLADLHSLLNLEDSRYGQQQQQQQVHMHTQQQHPYAQPPTYPQHPSYPWSAYPQHPPAYPRSYPQQQAHPQQQVGLTLNP
jgi:hypothetical protein